jgi:lysophospholipase L1-like esterase
MSLDAYYKLIVPDRASKKARQFFAAFFFVLLAAVAGDLQAASCPVTIDLAAGSRIAFEGDSLIYGQDETQTGNRPPINGAGQRRSASPLPEYVAELLKGQIEVENRGFPGDRTVDGLQRWRHVRNAAVVFIMYGANDAMNFSGHPGGIVGLPGFVAGLKQLVDRRKSEGALVVLMTPPPVGVSEWDLRISPYRTETEHLALDLGIPTIHTSEVLSNIGDKWVDGLHLNERSLKALAQNIANCIRIIEFAKKRSDAP